MNARHGPIVHSGSTEGTTVAAAVFENPPRVGEIVAILPNCSDDVLIRVGVLLVQPIGDRADPVAAVPSAAVAFSGHWCPLVRHASSFARQGTPTIVRQF